ncbi:MAG: hypothetical protein AAFQ91_29960, partial [Cyanobacteria bacterium J06621_15]
MTILRKFTAIFLALSLCFTTVACGGETTTSTPQARNVSRTTTNTRISIVIACLLYGILTIADSG